MVDSCLDGSNTDVMSNSDELMDGMDLMQPKICKGDDAVQFDEADAEGSCQDYF